MNTKTISEVDLIALISSDLSAGMDTGKWHKFICPFCRHMQKEIKYFLLVTNEGERGRYVCKFCNRSGDALQWLKDYRRMALSQALEYLRGPYVQKRNARAAVPAVE
jgi:hypothetical protein